jgi:hypothetical protein
MPFVEERETKERRVWERDDLTMRNKSLSALSMALDGMIEKGVGSGKAIITVITVVHLPS